MRRIKSASSEPGPFWLPSDDGVSEVLSAVMAFALVGVVVAGSVFALVDIQGNTTERSARIQADRMAAQTALAASTVLAQAAEASGSYAVTLTFPHDLEGQGYTILLEDPHTVAVSRTGQVLSRHVLPGSGSLPVCPSSVAGGSLMVAFEDVPTALEAACGLGPTDHALVLRPAP